MGATFPRDLAASVGMIAGPVRRLGGRLAGGLGDSSIWRGGTPAQRAVSAAATAPAQMRDPEKIEIRQRPWALQVQQSCSREKSENLKSEKNLSAKKSEKYSGAAYVC